MKALGLAQWALVAAWLGGCGLVLDLDPDDPPPFEGSQPDAASPDLRPETGMDQSPDRPQDARVDGAAERGVDANDDAAGDDGVEIGPSDARPDLGACVEGSLNARNLGGDVRELQACIDGELRIAQFEAVDSPGLIEEDNDPFTDACFRPDLVCGLGERPASLTACTGDCATRASPGIDDCTLTDSDADGMIDEDCPLRSACESTQNVNSAILTLVDGTTCFAPRVCDGRFRFDSTRLVFRGNAEIRAAVPPACDGTRIVLQVVPGFVVNGELTLHDVDIEPAGGSDSTEPLFIVERGAHLRIERSSVTYGRRGFVRVDGGELSVVASSVRTETSATAPAIDVRSGQVELLGNCENARDCAALGASDLGIFGSNGRPAVSLSGPEANLEVHSSWLGTEGSAASAVTVEEADEVRIIRSRLRARTDGGRSAGLLLVRCAEALVRESAISTSGPATDAIGIDAVNCPLWLEESGPFATEGVRLFSVAGSEGGLSEFATGLLCRGSERCHLLNATVMGATVSGGDDDLVFERARGVVSAGGGGVRIERSRLVGHRGIGLSRSAGTHVGLHVREGSEAVVGRSVVEGSDADGAYGVAVDTEATLHAHDSVFVAITGQGGTRGVDASGAKVLGALYARHSLFAGRRFIGSSVTGTCAGVDAINADLALFANLVLGGPCENPTPLRSNRLPFISALNASPIGSVIRWPDGSPLNQIGDITFGRDDLSGDVPSVDASSPLRGVVDVRAGAVRDLVDNLRSYPATVGPVD
ncbi:MAG: hypothetical protein AAF645_01770 [Myxococcota bacterium]